MLQLHDAHLQPRSCTPAGQTPQELQEGKVLVKAGEDWERLNNQCVNELTLTPPQRKERMILLMLQLQNPAQVHKHTCVDVLDMFARRHT